MSGFDGRLACTAGDDNTVRLWDMSKNELRAELAHNGPAEAVVFSNDSKTLLTGSEDHTARSSPVISVNEIPQITLRKNEGELLSLSFELRNKNDDVLVKMEDNWFTAYPRNVKDMIVTPKTKEVKVWLAQDDVGLEFSFSRITMAELEKILSEDRKNQETSARDHEQIMLANAPPEIREIMKRAIEEGRLREKQPPSEWWLRQLERLPPEMREARLAVDPTGHLVKSWARKNCVMDDGLIPFLDFEQMAIYFHGERIVIKNGVADSLFYCSAFENNKGAVNLLCRCQKCLPRPR
jgi:hypothetical protein